MGVIRRAAVALAVPLVVLGAPAVAAAADPPTVTGASTVGSTLTASDPQGLGDGIKWITCGGDGTQTALDTGTTYRLKLSDAGTTVCALETDAFGLPASDQSAPTGPVGGLPPGAGPAISVAPGQPVAQGQVLTVTQDGVWGDGTQSITDTWQDCNADGSSCQAVATGPTYTVGRADANRAIVLTQTATASNGNSATASTAPTAPATGTAPTNATAPTIAGTAAVGAPLTASPGTWSNDPTGYGYQWARCANGGCTAIPGAVGATYVPVADDVGSTLEVLVTAAVYSSVSSAYPSFPSGTVAPGTGVSPPSKSPTKQPTRKPGKKRRATKPKRKTSRPLGRIASTAQWTFHYTPAYTQVLALDLHTPPLGSTVTVRCAGRGCPYAKRNQAIVRPRHCGPSGHATTTGTHRPKRKLCPVPRVLHLQRGFGRRRLRAGARLTITVTRRRYVGKYYRFVIRAGRQPTVQISCLAPGSGRPGKGCTAG